MSPEQSDLRKSLESIQSLLSQNRSPMTATSLASRIHRASLESSTGGGGGFQPRFSNESHHTHDGRGGGSLEGRGSNSSSVSFQRNGASTTATAGLTSPLAPIAEPNGGIMSSGGSTLSPQSDIRDSLSRILSPHPPSSSRDSLSYTPFQQIEIMAQQKQQQPFHHHGDGGAGSVIRSPSSAFSTVNKNILSPGAIDSAISSLGGPPFGAPPSFGGLGATTPSGSSVMSGAFASISSASRTGGQTMASSHIGGLDTAMSSAGKSHHGARRETSLLVSPVSQQHSAHHSHSPQSEVSASAASVFGSQAASPPGYAAIDDHATPSSAASARSANSSTVKHGPTGTPMVAFLAAGKNSITPATAGLTIHTNLQQQQPPSNNNGRDPTPYHYRSNPSTSPYENNNRGKENYGNDSKKHSDASSRSGLDPPAKSPFPTSINASISSSDGGKGTPRHGHSSSSTSSSGYTTGFATNKSTPNIHSQHYKDNHTHQLEENELSMIEEDESLGDNESLVSHVTGGTFVRSPTPFAKKQYGHTHTPKNNAGGNHTGGHSTAGNSHHGAHHTPRSNSHHTSQHYATPGSMASTTIHATPSTSQLLHRPSLAMRENLGHLATTTSHALEEIWDQVGVAPDDRASQLADLVERIGQLCEEKVRDEEGVRDQFRKEIQLARQEWEETSRALALEGEEDPLSKMRRDPSSKDLGGSSGVSLQWEYEAMMGRLESLRSVKEAAVTDMQVSQLKIYEAFAALNGCTVEEAAQANEMQPYSDIESNLTLDRREDLRNEANEYEERVAERTKAIVSLLLDCHSAIRDLGMAPPEISMGRCEDDVKIMNSLLEPIEEESNNNNRRRGQSSQYTIVSLFESSTCIGIGNSALDRLTSRIAELNGEKYRRRSKLSKMGEAIGTLWTMLRVPAQEQDAFTTNIRGLGLDTLRKGEAEIARLEELKIVIIGKLVREQRSVIEELWDKTNSSADERASFNAYFHIHEDDDQLTSEVLVKHEEYVAALKAKLDKMQPILDLIAKREAIIEERCELEFLQKDPDRLNGRGAHKQLMKEEKMSRRVNKELPKITFHLEKTLRQWYAENKPDEEGGGHHPDIGHFMYDGTPYLHTIQCQEEEWRTRKERGEQERQRKRQEERTAASSANAAFGYSAYTKLPGKKWNSSTNANNNTGAATTATSSRPRSASNMRVGRSGSNMRSGGRGPLGDVSSSRQNTSRPPSRPRGGGAGGAGVDRGKKTAARTGRGYRPASAPRMRL